MREVINEALYSKASVHFRNYNLGTGHFLFFSASDAARKSVPDTAALKAGDTGKDDGLLRIG